MHTHFRYFLYVLLLLSAGNTAYAQHPTLASQQDKLFERGLSLHYNEQWSAARSVFEEYLAGHASNNLQGIEAEYYIAQSALRLYNDDAEVLAENFIRKHPEHPKALLAYYELGKFYASDKKYSKAAQYLAKVNTAALNTAERNEVDFTLAYAYFSDRKFDEALERFNRLKRGNSSYAAASSYYAGYIYYTREQFEQALLDLQHAAKTPEFADQVTEMIATIYYRQGNYDQLFSYLNNKSDKGRSADLQLLTAEAYFKQSQFEQAAARFQQYLDSKRSASDDIYYRAGYSLYQTGQQAQAADYFKHSAERNDSLGQYASYYLGVSYLAADNKTFARNAFSKAAQMSHNPRISEESLYNVAKLNFEAQAYDAAADNLKELLEKYPKSAYRQQVSELLSQALLQTQDYAQAIAYMEQLQTKTPRVRKAYQEVTFLRASENFNASRFYQAVQLFDKSLKYPEDPQLTAQAYFWKGEAYAIGKRWNDAINSYAGVFRSLRPSDPLFLRARYGIGYAYFNSKQYDKALVHFKEYVTQGGKSAPNYADALLRLGDSYYTNKLYGNAYDTYNRAIQENNPEADYAWFQLGLVASLNEQNKKAQEAWGTLLSRYPQSAFRDDAQFNQAQLLLESGAYQQAETQFERFLQSNPQSPFIPYALRSLALAHFNRKAYAESAERYKQLLRQYPTHQTANSALLGLQEVLALEGKTDEFEQYLAEYKRANPGDRSLENVEFEAAKTHYFAQNYDRAIPAFRQYMQNYPQSVNATEARFYLAEAYVRTNKPAEAKTLYRELLMNARGNLLQRTVQRLAELAYNERDFGNALSYYHQLRSMASNKRQQTDAWQGLMLTHFEMSRYDSVGVYADRIEQEGITTGGVLNRALLYKAKAAYAQGDFERALSSFRRVAESAQDENGAEALYNVGYIQHLQKNYQQSVETLFTFNSRFSSFRTWLGKSFLLIADNYVAMGERFQAKETLRSIIENAKDDALVAEAKQKLAALEAQDEATEPEQSVDIITNNQN